MSLKKLMGLETTDELGHCNCNSAGAESCLNMTICGHTTGTDTFTVAAWNPQGQTSTQMIHVPVVGGKGWTVQDLANQGEEGAAPLLSQAIPISKRTLELPMLYLNSYNMTEEEQTAWKKDNANPATHVLSIQVTMPAMGYTTLVATRATEESIDGRSDPSTLTTQPRLLTKEEGTTKVTNGKYELEFDGTTGLMTSVTNLISNITTPLSIEWGWYNSSVGGCTEGIEPHDWSCDSQKSGAYIFRPNSSTFFYPGPKQTPTVEIMTQDGGLVTEVRQTFSEWATHVIRLYKGDDELSSYIEVEWTVGPIPMDTPWMDAVVAGKSNLWGKEVSMRYSTGLQSNGTFYTDSNGREMVKRVYNERGPSYPPLNVTEPIAGNYYPINSMISLDDGCAELAIITDVAMGGASLHDGQLELMVHRRVQDDDSRGVQEPLNETMCGCNDVGADDGKMGAHGHEGDGGCVCAGLTVRGRHWLVLDTVEKTNELRRKASEKLSFPATLAFANKALAPKVPTFTSLQEELPENVKLMTVRCCFCCCCCCAVLFCFVLFFSFIFQLLTIVCHLFCFRPFLLPSFLQVTDNYRDINNGASLLRLSHLYSVGEHPTLSLPAKVNLASVFGKAGFVLDTIEETSLTGNQPPIQKKDKFQWKTKVLNEGVQQQLDEFVAHDVRVPFNKDTTEVTLRPMELRTFFVTWKRAGDDKKEKKQVLTKTIRGVN